MAHKLRIAADKLKDIYPSAGIEKKENRFYQIVSQEKYNSQNHPNSIRKEIFSFQQKHEYYFRLFLPKVQNRNGEKSFEYDMKVMNSSQQSPSLREICAASEVIENEIQLILFTDEIWSYRFVPLLNKVFSTDKTPLVLLMTLDENENPFFLRVTFETEQDNIELQCSGNNKHVRCLDKRFRNSFRDLEDMSLMTDLKLRIDTSSTNIWGLLSLVIYGDANYRENLKSMIFDFQTKEENIETYIMLFDLHTYSEKKDIANAKNSTFRKEKKTTDLWKEAIQKRLDGKEIGKGELFAAASILNCPIYFKTTEWEMYLPFTTNYEKPWKTPLLITLEREHKIKMAGSFDHDCLCDADIPKVDGPLHLLKEQKPEFLKRELVFKTCCEVGRRKFHGHMCHIEGSKTDLEERISYTEPIPEHLVAIVEQLEEEERQIDQINGGKGSLEQSISKDIFGDESHAKEVRDIIGDVRDCGFDACLQTAANWTEITIYVKYRNVWFSFIPQKSQNRQPRCRYYITLLYTNENGKYFDRVTPKVGCNCHVRPPVTFMRNDKIGENIPTIHYTVHHRPMVTFPPEDPSEEMFEKDEIRIPVFGPYSELRFIMNREDMEGRVIDMTEEYRLSLYRCISKMIFGTEKHYQLILNAVISEINDNPSLYAQFVSAQADSTQSPNTEKKPVYGTFRFKENTFLDHFRRKSTIETEKARFLTDRLKNSLEVNDLGLIAIATTLQTPINLLTTRFEENKFSSFWQRITQIRTKRKPADLSERRHVSSCEHNAYFMTLLKSSTGQFYIICPVDGCNCQSAAPNEPGEDIQDSSDFSPEEFNMFIWLLEVDNRFSLVNVRLDNWISALEELKIMYENLIEMFEKRRNNVNKVSIVSASSGIIGSILIFSGIVAAPFTVGASFPLAMAGGVLGGASGITTVGAKTTEIVLTKKGISDISLCQERFKEITLMLKNAIDLFIKLFMIDESVHVHETHIGLDVFPGLVRAVKEATILPLVIFKTASKGASIASSFLLPVAFLIDVAIIVTSIRNSLSGSRTEESRKLRNALVAIGMMKIQMEAWAYGNSKSK